MIRERVKAEYLPGMLWLAAEGVTDKCPEVCYNQTIIVCKSWDGLNGAKRFGETEKSCFVPNKELLCP